MLTLLTLGDKQDPIVNGHHIYKNNLRSKLLAGHLDTEVGNGDPYSGFSPPSLGILLP